MSSDNPIDVYKELATDLLTATHLGMDQAVAIVSFLKDEGFIDYDQLKEYYIYEDDD